MDARVTARAAPAADRFVDLVTRIGFVGKGFVALVIGGVALRLALGRGGDLVGPEGALLQFVGRPLGRTTHAFLALALGAHAFWMVVQAIFDPERKGRGFAAVAERVSWVVTALGYAALGYAAARLALGLPLGPGGDIDEVVASVLTPHVGRWAVGVAGAVGVVIGVLQIRLAVVAGFRAIFPLDRMGRIEGAATIWLGRAGYASLGVVSGIIGWFLLRVAFLFDPEQAGGWRDALGFLAGLSDTPWPLGIVAAGLVCYGLYFVLQARYRRADTIARA